MLLIYQIVMPFYIMVKGQYAPNVNFIRISKVVNFFFDVHGFETKFSFASVQIYCILGP